MHLGGIVFWMFDAAMRFVGVVPKPAHLANVEAWEVEDGVYVLTLDPHETKPMFVQHILANMWNVYDRNVDTEKLAKMLPPVPAWKVLGLNNLKPRAVTVREMLSRWSPFADAVLEMTARRLSSPNDAAPGRLPVLCPRWFSTPAADLDTATAVTAQGIVASDPRASVVASVTKFLADLESYDVYFVCLCGFFPRTPGAELHVMGWFAAQGDGFQAPPGGQRWERLCHQHWRCRQR